MDDGGAVLVRDSVIPEWARAGALYFALTLLLAYPLSVRPGSTALPGDPDTDLMMWTLAWDTHALVSQPLAIFDANIYYPQATTLAYSENAIGSVPFAAPVLWLTGNPVLALNVVALLSVVLCGLGAYVLARRLGLGPVAAFLCGVIFAFSPVRFFRIGQLHLTTVQWVPFGLAALHTYLDGGRPRHLKLAAFLFTLQALTTGHGAVFLALGMLGLVAWRVTLGESIQPWRRMRDLGVTGALLLLPTALVFLPYRSVQVEMGLRRSLVDWAPTPESFIASPAAVPTWLASLAPNLDVIGSASAFLFPGFLPILLAVAAFVWRRRAQPAPLDPEQSRWRRWAGAHRRNPLTFYGLLTLVSVLLSVGPPLGIWPLVYWLPGLNFIRVPSRFTILALLGLAVLAAIGYERLASRFAQGRRPVLALVLGALLVVEFAAIPLPTRPYAVTIPAADRWLAGRPKPFVVAELPVDDSDRIQTTYMLHAMAHWQKTVHGHSGLRPELHVELYHQLRSFPDEVSIASLQRLNVDYVVVHSEFYEPADWERTNEQLHAFSSRLVLEHEEDGARVYSLIR